LRIMMRMECLSRDTEAAQAAPPTVKWERALEAGGKGIGGLSVTIATSDVPSGSICQNLPSDLRGCRFFPLVKLRSNMTSANPRLFSFAVHFSQTSSSNVVSLRRWLPRRQHPVGSYSIRRVDTQSCRDIATASIPCRLHQACSSPKRWFSR